MGPLWMDVEGFELDAVEKEMLSHPTIGGVILFARNYHDNEQLRQLTSQIRTFAKRPILIGVDQEGGRVQRFREGFSLIPPANAYQSMPQSEQAAQLGGWLMAAELIAHDIDLSFAPVLDKGFSCKAISTRAFGEDVESVLRYSHAYMQGMKQAGMATTGKHFPGHGGVLVDSHHETPFDHRSDVIEKDMAIFKAHIDANLLDAMMPAHVVYPHFDEKPASGSSFWLKQILREKLNFKGIIFSDDLNMEGAAIMGGASARSQQALDAGCDMLLLCNNRLASIEVLDHLKVTQMPTNAHRLFKKHSFDLATLKRQQKWQQASAMVQAYWDKQA